jgi:isopenicillin N synthase-like dioxygenase
MNEAFPPVVDLTSPSAPQLIDDACRHVGFFQVVGHGIDQDLLDAVFSVADSFFGQELEAKIAWESGVPEVERGYSAKGTEGLSYSLGLDQPPDLFEALTFGLDEVPVDDPGYCFDQHHQFAPNIWPTEPADLKAVMLAYYDAAFRLTRAVMSQMAVALGMPSDYFAPFTDKAIDVLRINYFEGRPGDAALPNQYGIGPHTDYGMLTLLLADQEPALQVYTENPDTQEEEWRYVVPVPGAILVNVADLLTRWTNDRWRSTLHRVLPVLSDGNTVRRRRSVPYFCSGNYDAIIECLPTCTDADNPPLYPPLHGGKHVEEKTLSGRLLEAADAESTLGDRVKALSS